MKIVWKKYVYTSFIIEKSDGRFVKNGWIKKLLMIENSIKIWKKKIIEKFKKMLKKINISSSPPLPPPPSPDAEEKY